MLLLPQVTLYPPLARLPTLHSRFDNKKTGAVARREGGWCHWLLMHPKQGDETHGIPNATPPSLRKGTYLS